MYTLFWCVMLCYAVMCLPDYVKFILSYPVLCYVTLLYITLFYNHTLHSSIPNFAIVLNLDIFSSQLSLAIQL